MCNIMDFILKKLTEKTPESSKVITILANVNDEEVDIPHFIIEQKCAVKGMIYAKVPIKYLEEVSLHSNLKWMEFPRDKYLEGMYWKNY